MKIFILASEDEEEQPWTYTWLGRPRQLASIRGKPLLSRTVSMLEGLDYIILTHSNEIIDSYPNCIVPKNRNNFLNTILSSRDYWEVIEKEDEIEEGEVCFLMGDVVFTKKALDQILKPTNKSLQFYSSSEEIFAFRFTKEMYNRVEGTCIFLADSPLVGVPWELYRQLVGIPLDKHWVDFWFNTSILDKTNDLDYFKDYKSKILSHYFDSPEFDL